MKASTSSSTSPMSWARSPWQGLMPSPSGGRYVLLDMAGAGRSGNHLALVFRNVDEGVPHEMS